MRIVNNLNGQCHWDVLVRNSKRATDLVIVSPFTDEILLQLIRDGTGPNLRSLVIVTRIYDTPAEAFASASRLVRVLDWAEANPSVAVEIHENPKLHGKIYLTKTLDGYNYGLLGSANCTNYGLRLNHEWSVEITEKTVLESIWVDVKGSLPRSTVLRRAHLEAIAAAASAAVMQNREAVKAIKAMRLNLEELLPNRRPAVVEESSIRQTRNEAVWLKPVGDSRTRITPSDDYWTFPHNLHFARRPVSVEVGHFVIAYATGWKKIVGLFEITGRWRQQSPTELAAWPEGARWPWVAEARPLTPRFSQNWYAEDLSLEELVRSYTLQSMTKEERDRVTRIIPAIRARSDKVKLSLPFAEYVITELYRRDNIT